MAVWPAEIGTSTGLETNQHWRVLNQQEMPIDGLYVCGNDMSSMIRGKHPGPGATLGHAIVFGCLAAFHAVTQKYRRSQVITVPVLLFHAWCACSKVGVNDWLRV